MARPTKTIKQYEAEATRKENGCLIHPNVNSCARHIYKLRHGEIPKPLCVCHTCDTPRCIEDSHHWLGTNKENIHDSVKKNRFHGNKGNHLTAEHKKNLSKALKGRKLSSEWVKKNRAAHLGKPLSDEHRAAISAGHLGKIKTKAHRAAISKTLMGHEVTEETRAKLSESWKIKQEFFDLMLQNEAEDD